MTAVFQKQAKGSFQTAQNVPPMYPTHQWIKTMETFRDALMGMHQAIGGTNPPVTKVCPVRKKPAS